MLEQIKHERIQKAEQMWVLGYNPYPYTFERTHLAQEIETNYDSLSKSNTTIAIAGRVMARRDHGKTNFMDIIDISGRVQIVIRQDVIGEQRFALYELVDIGDIVGIQGTVFKTKIGEISVLASTLEVLCKSLHPLPDKWHGLKDIETRYRQRYVDLIMNPEVRQVFLTRTKIVNTIRKVFNAIGGVEVETPTLQPIYGGASARPFVTHHNALDTEFFLRIADELYLKRLIVGGFECVYEICKDFRNEGMDKAHNPEFTMVEIYWAYRDYNDMMNLTEGLFATIAKEVIGSFVIEYQGEKIDLTPPWPRRPMLDLIKEYGGVDVATQDDNELRVVLKKIYEETLGNEALAKALQELNSLNRGNLIAELFEQKVEPHLMQPTFVTDFPKETSPLAKIHRTNPSLTERFELFIYRREMANSFSELNDPIDQRERFEAEMRHMEGGDEEAQPLDEDFLRALEYGMPPTGGLGIGVDRLTMLFTNQSSIQDVIFFPQMRPEEWVYKFTKRTAQEL